MDYLTVTEIAEKIGLSRQKTTERAKRENWQGRVRQGRGGGVEYEVARLPLYIQLAIRERLQQQVLMSVEYPALPVVRVNDGGAAVCLDGSTETQRTQLGARLAVLQAVERLMRETGVGREAAITTMLTLAQSGGGYDALARVLRLANDRRGGGSAFPCKRTIQRWFKQRDGDCLMARVPQKCGQAPEWFARFLKFYQTPQKPSVQTAFERFVQVELVERPLEKLPSVHQARRWLARLGNVFREEGRMGRRELKNVLPFKRRRFDDLLPCDVYSMDGHTFDAEVLHPDSGKPFRPEITTVLDVATRKIVGWSVDLAESGLAVAAALAHACVENGVAHVLYVDNGKGYDNALMKDEALGLMGRLGMTMVHSLPYQSQARGVIERIHQTVWVQAAKSFQSYLGKDMDAEASQRVHKLSRQAMRQELVLKDVPALANIRSFSASLIPDWREFVGFAEVWVGEYNNRPHRSLPKVIDVSGCRRHMTPNEMWALKAQDMDITSIGRDEAVWLFMPQTIRKVARGEVQLHNNRYFSRDLQEFHGESLRVAYDIHDAQWIWLFDDDGRFVCKAEWNGNEIDYMPKSFLEQAKEKRVNRQVQRLNVRQAVLEAARPKRVIEHQACVDIGGQVLDMRHVQEQADGALARMQRMQPKVEVLDVQQSVMVPSVESVVWRPPECKEERYALYVCWRQGLEVSEEVARWCVRYAKTGECRYFEKQSA